MQNFKIGGIFKSYKNANSVYKSKLDLLSIGPKMHILKFDP